LPLAAAALALGACKSIEVPKLPSVTPYRMVIQQGNYISDEMVAQLKPGMSKEQVRFVLGTPLVTDIFHADRWDYVFFRELPNGKREQRNLSVVFQDSKLVRVIGDILPGPDAPKPAPVAKPAAEPKPAAEAKPAAEPAPQTQAKPAAPAENWEPTKQNWGSAPVEPEKPAPQAREEEQKPAEEKKEERGFFGRLLDRITPGSRAEAKPAPETEAPKPEAAPAKEEESKPAEEKK
jgi:outer membrane protein assembly factor BamE